MKRAHRFAGIQSSHLATGILFALMLLALPAVGQEFTLSDIATEGNVSVEQLESAINSVEAREDLDDEIRGSVIEQLRDAQAQLQNRVAAEAAAETFTQALNTAPAESEELRAILDSEVPAPPTVDSLGITDTSTLEDLTQLMSIEIAEQVAVESRLGELNAQIEVQEDRPVEARTRINELRSSRAELAAILEVPPSSGEQQILAEARTLNMRLRRAAQGAETVKLEQELLSHNVRLNLLKAQLDVTERSRLQVVGRVELFRAQVNERRQVAANLAQDSAAAAELAAADDHPAVRALAESNADLTRRLPEVVVGTEQAAAELIWISGQAQDFEQRLAGSQQRVEVGGLSRTIGRLLVEESRNLPQVSQYRVQFRARSSMLAEAGIAQVRIREQRRELSSVETRVEAVMAEVALDISDSEELETMRGQARLLLRDKRELLDEAERVYSNYLQVLGDLDNAERRLLEASSKYKEFLDQNLLWIPSAPIAFTGKWRATSPTSATALSPAAWMATAGDLAESLRQHPVQAVFALLLLAALLATRRPLAKLNRSMNDKIGRLSTDNIGLTLTALAIAAIRAAPLSLLLMMMGLFLRYAPDNSAFSHVVESSLLAVAPFLYNVLLLRVLSTKGGVLNAHFGWSESTTDIIRRQLDRVVAIGVPLVFATALFYASDVADDRATLGRVVFVSMMILLAMTFRPLAHPKSGVVASYYSRKPTRWLSKLRWVWYGIAIGMPLFLCVLSLLGYIYSSLILTGLLVDTIWLTLTLIVANLIILRWLALTHRKMALKLLLKEREAQRASQGKEAETEAEGELPSVESKPLDLETVDQQTKQLFRFGLAFVAILAGWRIWADFFPAFGLLDRVALWSQTVIVDGVETIAPVTLSNVLLALLVAAGTAIASKNLPGLMEIAILQRLKLQSGSRYAINTLVQYFVVTIGTISVLNIIGWNWSQIQWLAAALSVGLGFGLQEIVANFVSGLIILFERPVRVGDTVTVGALSGTVSRIRIRATTITDWDRKEIIVPNKSFITEQVVNWTLADPITRVVVPVGISYGSDVDLATRVMQDTLVSLQLVLDEPPPKVYFLGFGDSSLDFKLYVYSRQLADRFPLMHAVHEAILKALREHDIQIPFPQRDLHVFSTTEGKNE